jgi:hypothetical protein
MQAQGLPISPMRRSPLPRSKKHLDVKNDASAKVGKVGLWTKADAETYFDEFRVKPAGDK